ncbi:MAG TPA: hypothetical protein VKB88_01805 [Bryobacteraceae bacterium]|nr:hypothetical protein [Bryobacteraceae bacterium]
MVLHKLTFTPYDIELIDRGLTERVAAKSLGPDESRRFGVISQLLAQEPPIEHVALWLQLGGAGIFSRYL